MDRAGHLKINDSFLNVIPETPENGTFAPPDGDHPDFKSCAVPVHPTPVISFPEPKHRCRTYPCPICGGAGDSSDHQLDTNISKVDNIYQIQQLQQPLPQGTAHLESVAATTVRHPSPMISFPEPTHRCRTWPCPVCGAGYSMMMSYEQLINPKQQLLPLSLHQEGTGHSQGLISSAPVHPPTPISFPEPQHRCRTWPCPVCGAGYAMKMSYEQLIHPKRQLLPLNHQEGTGHSQGLISSAPVHPPTPISFPEPQHRCRTFPCPVCGEAGDDQHQLITNSNLFMNHHQQQSDDLSHLFQRAIQCCS